MKILSSIKTLSKLHQNIQNLNSWSESRFNTLNTLFKFRQGYKENDKDFVDDIIDRFVDKVNTLINDEDDIIPEKRRIMRMINKVWENRKYSKIAKEKFQQILENKCKEYGYDPVQEYCKICKRDDFDENGDYNPCCHFKEKIDFVNVFEFAKFSKEYCEKYENHYAVGFPNQLI
ncbi:hypothetical protein C2G38_2046105 [Gigaspora rosea]|uniref:Uncharacterized protein n=1 Tax=Gigaspora rosea TaxID=44941 RepID=A0A397UAI0_9GLOM|nr:hypothetical protein C2G38_2046105 [Gigaspora rosea]